MAKTKKGLSDAELVTLINQEKSSVDVESFDTLSAQRIQSNYSFAHEFTQETRPKDAMSTVLWNLTNPVVETLSTYMVKQFCSSKKTVEFNPMNPRLSKVADQAAKMANTVLHKMNPGYAVLAEGFKSAAINKNAVWYTYYDESRIEPIEEMFEGLTKDEIDVIVAEREEFGYVIDELKGEATAAVIVEGDEMIEGDDLIELTDEVMEVAGSDWTIRMHRPANAIVVECVPPEEFMINEGTTSINNSELTRFVARRRMMYASDIEAWMDNMDVKFDITEVGEGPDTLDKSYEKDARHYVDGTFDNDYKTDTGHAPTHLYEVTEAWIRADVDGDGYAEWRHAIVIGGTLLFDEEWFGPLPFTSFTFFDIPHKFYGLSVYDKLKQYEKTAVALVRGNVNSTVIRNTPRWLYNSSAINPTVLNKITTGFIGVKGNVDLGAVARPLETSGGAPGDIQPIITMIREQVIGEIGIDPIKGQVSSDVEKSGNDAVKTAMTIDNASARIEKYARAFAETALRDIVWSIVTLLVQHKDKPFVKELAASITPDAPVFALGELGLPNVLSKTDITAKVGLGHMTGPQKIAASEALMQMITALEQNPSKAMYNLISESLIGWGYDNPEEIIGPADTFKQKAEMFQQQQQSTIQAQQSQAQVAQGQIQMQQTQMQIMQQEAAYKEEIARQESQAKIALMQAQAAHQEAKAGSEQVSAAKDEVEMQKIAESGAPTETRVSIS